MSDIQKDLEKLEEAATQLHNMGDCQMPDECTTALNNHIFYLRSVGQKFGQLTRELELLQVEFQRVCKERDLFRAAVKEGQAKFGEIAQLARHSEMIQRLTGMVNRHGEP